MGESIKCANCGADISSRAPQYDDEILLVCNAAPCQHALDLVKQSSFKERAVWKKAAELLTYQQISKETEDSESEPEPEPSDEDVLEEGLGLEFVGHELGDDQTLKKFRERIYSGPPVFQKYQFRLNATAAASSKGNRGGDPNAYFGDRLETMANTGVDVDLMYGSSSKNIEKPSGIAAAADAMGKGFSTGVLSSKFDYTEVPRELTARTAWVGDERRFHDFIARKITDEAVSKFEALLDAEQKGAAKLFGLKDVAKLFGLALKAYINLYEFFNMGMSDAALAKLMIPSGLWSGDNGKDNPNSKFQGSRRVERSRLLAAGFELYGSPSDNLPFPSDSDEARTKRIWPIFMKAVRRVFREMKPNDPQDDET